MKNHNFKPVKEILVEMINAGIIGQSWLSDKEYKKKIEQKRKEIDSLRLLF